jgi:hypothetical protein
MLVSVLVFIVFLSEKALGPELKERELNASQLQAPPGAFHRNTPSRARLGARLDGSVGLKLAVSQLNHSQGLRKMVLCYVYLHN